ncbi:hypothetical protein LINPERHAP2_LOCUS40254 [Linum perenne]
MFSPGQNYEVPLRVCRWHGSMASEG